MYELRAICDSHRCTREVFTVRRKQVEKRSTSGQSYIIDRVVCPRCRMWAKVTGIKQVRK